MSRFFNSKNIMISLFEGGYVLTSLLDRKMVSAIDARIEIT